jgi:hypothetical protein
VKLIYAFMVLGEQKITTGVEGAGKLRKITVTWMAKDDPHLPPATWADGARGEAEYQRANEANPNPLRNV